MRVTRVLLIVLCLLIPTIAGAQIWESFEGTDFSGDEDLTLVLKEVETPYSVAEFDGAYWEANVHGDGATVSLCLNELYYHDGELVDEDGRCLDHYWDPSARAYIVLGTLYQGYRNVSIVVFQADRVRFISGRAVEANGGYHLLFSPLWKWEHSRVARVPFVDELLR